MCAHCGSRKPVPPAMPRRRSIRADRQVRLDERALARHRRARSSDGDSTRLPSPLGDPPAAATFDRSGLITAGVGRSLARAAISARSTTVVGGLCSPAPAASSASTHLSVAWRTTSGDGTASDDAIEAGVGEQKPSHQGASGRTLDKLITDLNTASSSASAKRAKPKSELSAKPPGFLGDLISF